MKTIITKLKNLATGIIIFIVLFLFFTNAKYVSDSIISTMKFCLFSLIPALFPYMVIASLISNYSPINTGFVALFQPFKKILGVCKKCTSPIILGNLCGFVTGPKLICEAFDKNDDKNGFTKSVILSSNAGIGFVISYVGIIIWDSIFFGVFLYFIQLFSSFFISKIMFIKNKSSQTENLIQQKKKNFFTSFSISLSSSANAIIIICSFTIIFSVIISLIYKTININENSVLGIFISSFLEISQGLSSSLKSESLIACAFFTGFSVGFSGLCVIFQIFSICDGYPLSKFKFFFSKLLQGIVCGILAMIYVSIFQINPTKTAVILESTLSIKTIIFISLFIFSSLNNIKNKIIKFRC